MYAILGSIQFDLITYFDGYEVKAAADFAEHARIQGKPALQCVGDKLDEVKINLALHAGYTDPEKQFATLRQAMSTHQALSLVFGNGDYKGQFVIIAIEGTTRQTDQAGTVMAMEAEVSLKEWVPSSVTPTPTGAAVQGSTTSATVVSSVPAAPIGAVPANISSMLSTITRGI
jgi:phage protein U